jgi:endo-alpha-1,4-polygalactosaminidase (GH114 family)
MNRLIWPILIASALASIGVHGALAASPGTGRLAAAATAPIEPPPDARWQYQLQARHKGNRRSGGIDVDVCSPPLGGGACVRPRVIDFDPYLDEKGDDVDSKPNRAGVRALHRAGGYAICYIDAGGIENYRPDYPAFLRWHRNHGRSLLGKPFSKRFPEERWANIGGARQRAFLLRMMERRTRLCARTGFDAVEYDVVEAWASGRSVTGWKVGYRDQIVYNRGLARIAHEHRLAVGLKNDLGQIPDLVGNFDFAINEECFTYDECGRLSPFIAAGKPVFHVEYTNTRREFCSTTEGLGFNSVRKSASFSLYAKPFRPCS